MLTVRRMNTVRTRAFMGTLTGGVRLHDAIAQLAREHDIVAGTFHPLGGVTEIEFRRRDFLTKAERAPLQIVAPCEIVGGHATICRQDGQPSVHAHLVVAYADDADPSSARLAGGHVNYAVCFAIEFTLLAHDGELLSRAFNSEAGMALWATG